jgi:hypothetical protein
MRRQTEVYICQNDYVSIHFVGDISFAGNWYGNAEVIANKLRSLPHTPAPDEKHEPRNTIERAEARATRAATLATLDTILKDLSGRSYIGLAIERVERERGRGWLREQLKESLRKQEGA